MQFIDDSIFITWQPTQSQNLTQLNNDMVTLVLLLFDHPFLFSTPTKQVFHQQMT